MLQIVPVTRTHDIGHGPGHKIQLAIKASAQALEPDIWLLLERQDGKNYWKAKRKTPQPRPQQSPGRERKHPVSLDASSGWKTPEERLFIALSFDKWFKTSWSNKDTSMVSRQSCCLRAFETISWKTWNFLSGIDTATMPPAFPQWSPACPCKHGSISQERVLPPWPHHSAQQLWRCRSGWPCPPWSDCRWSHCPALQDLQRESQVGFQGEDLRARGCRGKPGLN